MRRHRSIRNLSALRGDRTSWTLLGFNWRTLFSGRRYRKYLWLIGGYSALPAIMTNSLTHPAHAVRDHRNSLETDAVPAGSALTPFDASRCPHDARMVG